MSAHTFLAGALVVAGATLAGGALWARREADRLAASSDAGGRRALVEVAFAMALYDARQVSTERLRDRDTRLCADYGHGYALAGDLVALAATRGVLIERGVALVPLPPSPLAEVWR